MFAIAQNYTCTFVSQKKMLNFTTNEVISFNRKKGVYKDKSLLLFYFYFIIIYN